MISYVGVSTILEPPEPLVQQQIESVSFLRALLHGLDAFPLSSCALVCGDLEEYFVLNTILASPMCLVFAKLAPVYVVPVHGRLWCALIDDKFKKS